jgi:hypothetical protein
LGVLEAFNDAVDSLVAVLLRWAILLVLLKIGAIAHVGPKGRSTRPPYSNVLCHDLFVFGSVCSRCRGSKKRYVMDVVG